MGGGPSNSPPKQAIPLDDEKQLVEFTDSKAQNSPTWSWEIADLSNSENDNLINRLYPVLDTVDDYSAHGNEYTLETPKIAKDQVELVYAKSNFYIHPTTNTNDHVNGFIAVARNSFSEHLFLWIPEYLIESDDLETILSIDGQRPPNVNNPATIKLRRDDDLVMITPLQNIHSLYASASHQEKQGCFIVTTKEGDVLPSLWYHGTLQSTPNASPHDQWWVGHDIIEVLRLFLNVDRSRDDDSIFSVSEKTNEDQRRRYLASFGTNSSSASTITGHPAIDSVQKAVERVEAARWQILERLSHITRFSRDAANQVLGHPYARPIVPFLPPTVQQFADNATVRETIEDYDSASLYIAQWGIEPIERRQKTKPRLPIGVEREELDGSLLNGFEVVLANEVENVEHTRRPPVTAGEFLSTLDVEGQFKVTEGDLRQLIFQGGLEPDLRIEGWKYLLGVYPWKCTYDDREAIRRSKTEEYLEIKSKWFNDMEVQGTTKFEEEKHRINKDVHRTDRTVTFFAGDDLPNPDPDANTGTNANLETMKDILLTYVIAYNPDLGYVQGMSDLVAPIFVVMGDEAMTFWAFTHFMDRMKSNFYVDQSGMHQQLTTLESLIRFMDPALSMHLEKCESTNLFFCFRWLLIWFKREFQWGDVMKLWECIWTDYLSNSYHIFIALAILDQHRDVIIDNFSQFDEILKYINELSMTLELDDILERAEILFHQFRRRMDSIDKKRSELKSQLEIRSVWNSDKRQVIQQDLERLEVDFCLRQLLKRHPSLC